MTDKEKKCNCEEMTCPKGCSSKHTHKGFSCEKCQPKRYQETYPDKQKTDKEWYCECGEPANEGEHICPKTGGVKLGVFASEIAKELELNPHGEDLIYNKSVSLINSAKQEAYQEVVELLYDWGEHDRDCIRSQWSAGEPTKDGGYRQKLAGKWYQSRPIDKTPKCDCGFDEAIKALKTKTEEI